MEVKDLINLEDIKERAVIIGNTFSTDYKVKDGEVVNSSTEVRSGATSMAEWLIREIDRRLSGIENDLPLIPFDIEKAKNGADVRTLNGFKVKIFDYNFKDKYTGRISIAGKIEDEKGDTLVSWDQKGEMIGTKDRLHDLVIVEDINYEYRWIVVSLVTGYTSQLFASKEEADYERTSRSNFFQNGNYQIIKLRVGK